MDYEPIKLALTLLNMVVTAVIWVIVRQDRKERVTTDSIKDLEQSVAVKLKDKCTRISKLEADFRAMPTKEDIIRIHERLDETAKDSRTMVLMLGEISGQIKQINENKK